MEEEQKRKASEVLIEAQLKDIQVARTTETHTHLGVDANFEKPPAHLILCARRSSYERTRVSPTYGTVG